ncbi:DUF2637 domain-containing protein [Streptomyces sp. NPDC057910]|uniref:DUF2637 domain-containing protein n=1 Tax=Streptomyces sp. NPDC057910 TaxID=3346278 RepID=UPI0036E88656
MTSTHIDPPSPAPVQPPYGLRRMSVWDRAAIILLGAAGFAFSYDALRQVAIAIHARETLSYLFPVFIDGFIAYGVRALVLLRHRDFGARLYAWFLFLAATGSSLWANALHAITLNHGPQSGPSPLHLGDNVVGVLSTLAPLALAGSVHLYIIMARTAKSSVPDHPVHRPGPVPDDAGDDRASATTAQLDREQAGPATARELVSVPGPSRADGRDGSPADRLQLSLDKARTPVGPLAGDATDDVHLRDWTTGADGQDHPDGQHGPLRPDGEISTDGDPASDHLAGEDSPGPREADGLPDEQPASVPDEHEAPEDREVVDEWLTDLLPIAREASRQAGRISRDVVGQAVRARQPIGNDRLGELLAVLRQEEEKARQPAPAGSSSALW